MCGGSGKGTTNTTQQYTPNPATLSAGTQALTMAQQAASTPFSLPVAPVAGFNPTQQAAFSAVNAAQGMAQPYFQQASNYVNQAAQPVTAAQVASYYNPMAANVGAQMQNIFGQQQRNTTGSLTQAAGGVGADRIAVGQSELANQQGLAAGQTFSGLEQQALQAAQQQQQVGLNAGYGMANLGAGAQGAQLQGINAQLGVGGLQQQQQQAQLNAPYQNQLAQLAYPFQTAQYLAGITGGVSGALGGSQYGTSTPPAPSIFSQLAGLGTAAAGAYGLYNSASGGGSNSNGYMSYPNGIGGMGGAQVGYDQNGNYITAARGGSIPHKADGGPTGMGGSPGLQPFWGADQSYVPQIAMQPAPQHQFQQPQQQQNSGNSVTSDLGNIAKIATTVAAFLSRGGSVNPYAPMESYAHGDIPHKDGGGSLSFDDRFNGDTPSFPFAPTADSPDAPAFPPGPAGWDKSENIASTAYNPNAPDPHNQGSPPNIGESQSWPPKFAPTPPPVPAQTYPPQNNEVTTNPDNAEGTSGGKDTVPATGPDSLPHHPADLAAVPSDTDPRLPYALDTRRPAACALPQLPASESRCPASSRTNVVTPNHPCDAVTPRSQHKPRPAQQTAAARRPRPRPRRPAAPRLAVPPSCPPSLPPLSAVAAT